MVNRRPGDCGSKDADGTMLCSFSLKKSRKLERISAAVMRGGFGTLIGLDCTRKNRGIGGIRV